MWGGRSLTNWISPKYLLNVFPRLVHPPHAFSTVGINHKIHRTPNSYVVALAS